jgi:hypothetical protein
MTGTDNKQTQTRTAGTTDLQQVQFFKSLNNRKPCAELLARGVEFDKCTLCKGNRSGCHNEQLLFRTLVANGEFKDNDAPPVVPGIASRSDSCGQDSTRRSSRNLQPESGILGMTRSDPRQEMCRTAPHIGNAFPD